MLSIVNYLLTSIAPLQSAHLLLVMKSKVGWLSTGWRPGDGFPLEKWKVGEEKLTATKLESNKYF